MLSKNQVVAIRKAIEKMYQGTCTVIEYQKVRRENKSSGFEEVTVLEQQPCKLSYERLASANQTDTAASATQSVKVLMAPEVTIKTGSKLTITQSGVTKEFQNSGEVAVFDSHQEIMLDLFEGWS